MSSFPKDIGLIILRDVNASENGLARWLFSWAPSSVMLLEYWNFITSSGGRLHATEAGRKVLVAAELEPEGFDWADHRKKPEKLSSAVEETTAEEVIQVTPKKHSEPKKRGRPKKVTTVADAQQMEREIYT